MTKLIDEVDKLSESFNELLDFKSMCFIILKTLELREQGLRSEELYRGIK